MATRYVRKSGSDANDGLSPATAWATIGKALSNTGIAAGDSLYIGAGTYREVVTINFPVEASDTFILGDIDGSQTGDVGEVIWSAYTTNDVSAPTGANLTLNGRNNITMRYITFHTGTTHGINWNLVSNGIVIEDCVFTGGSQAVNVQVREPATVGFILRRCRIYTALSNAATVAGVQTSTADYDSKSIIEDNLMVGSGDRGIAFIGGGSGTFLAGNMIVRRNTIVGYNYGIRWASAWATSIPSTIVGNYLNAFSTGIWMPSTGVATEDYNVIIAGTSRTNITAGVNSVAGLANIAPILEVGQSELAFGVRAPFFGPAESSPLLGFGIDPSHVGAVDLMNRPRPAGAGLRNPSGNTNQAVGALERHDTAQIATDQFDVTPSIALTGPADHDLRLVLPAGAVTISIKVRYDTSHGTTNKPKAILLANAEVGVTAQTVTATVGVDAWETLTFSPITLTKSGIVTLRLISQAAAGNGKAWFDTVAIS